MIYQGDALTILKQMPEESVNMCVTSPPYYGLRDYGVDGQIGLEETPEQFIAALADVFDEVKRVLKPDGTLWVNIGDSYAGSGKGAWDNKDVQKEVYVPDRDSPQSKMAKTWSGIKPKDLIGIPWMLAFELRRRGWYLRQDIIWQKPNAMPESVRDRCTKSHEYIFLLSKSQRYFFNAAAIQEPRHSDNNYPIAGSVGALGNKNTRRRGSGNKEKKYRPAPGTPHLGGNIPYSGERETRNKRDVWTVATNNYKRAHFAVFPEQLIMPCILAGSPADGGGGSGLFQWRGDHRRCVCEAGPGVHRH